ncbi:Hsp20/alpha crystallin family protein [Candidatus Babeliales bacterium]|nr:Hsp20/alpha crystallin family protein [Candidatus Babeliales bacterium]
MNLRHAFVATLLIVQLGVLNAKNATIHDALLEEFDRVHHEFEELNKRFDVFFDNRWDSFFDAFSDHESQATMKLETKDGSLIASLVLPNFDPDHFKLSIERNMLKLSARSSARDDHAETARAYEFIRSLPHEVDAARTIASYKDGILIITMPLVKQGPTTIAIATEESKTAVDEATKAVTQEYEKELIQGDKTELPL